MPKNDVSYEERLENVKLNNEIRDMNLTVRRETSSANLTSFDDLDALMHVKQKSDLTESELADYNLYLKLRADARKKAEGPILYLREEKKLKTEQERNELSKKLDTAKKELNARIDELKNEIPTILDVTSNLENVFYEDIVGMTYEEYVEKVIDEIIEEKYGKEPENEEEKAEYEKRILSENANGFGDNSPESLEELRNLYYNKIITEKQESLNISVLGVNLKDKIKQDIPIVLENSREKQLNAFEKNFLTENAVIEYSTEKEEEKIYNDIELANKNSIRYVNGLKIAKSVCVDNFYVFNALGVIKNVQNQYKSMSGVGRFFSYLNPFKNPYRDARNNIKDMIAKLSERAEIDKKSIQDFVDGKVTVEPKVAENKPSYEELANKETEIENDIVMNGEPDYLDAPKKEETVEELNVNLEEKEISQFEKEEKDVSLEENGNQLEENANNNGEFQVENDDESIYSDSSVDPEEQEKYDREMKAFAEKLLKDFKDKNVYSSNNETEVFNDDSIDEERIY